MFLIFPHYSITPSVNCKLQNVSQIPDIDNKVNIKGMNTYTPNIDGIIAYQAYGGSNAIILLSSILLVQVYLIDKNLCVASTIPVYKGMTYTIYGSFNTIEFIPFK